MLIMGMLIIWVAALAIFIRAMIGPGVMGGGVVPGIARVRLGAPTIIDVGLIGGFIVVRHATLPHRPMAFRANRSGDLVSFSRPARIVHPRSPKGTGEG